MPSLRTLQAPLVPAAEQLLSMGRAYDRTLRVTSARRTRADQARLYERFLRGESSLPAAPPGSSLHEHGLAFDLARPAIDPHRDQLLAALGEVWNSWGGHWSKSDPVHFEVRPEGA
jgi:peptidoglycan L-alanyl-D-glutamate endopeptidase CwlK